MVGNYSAVLAWSDEDRAYVATCPEFPGLSGVAETAEEALRELHEALEMAIETFAEEHHALPPPKLLASHSGQVRLRMPKSLHSELVTQAEREGVSLNTLAVTLLSLGLGQRHASSAVTFELRHLLTEFQACIATEAEYRQAATLSANWEISTADRVYQSLSAQTAYN